MAAYRVAVCEDEEAVRALVCSWCREIFSGWGVEAQVSGFANAGELGEGDFDLYLLDIQMPGESGLSLARRLYESGVRDRVIFITGSAEYALEGYSAHPLHYLLKPVERQELAAALGLAWEKRRPRALIFRAGGKTAAYNAGDVRYLESRSHGVVINLVDGERYIPIPLTEAERSVPAESFARCHKSYLVNLAWVAEVGRTELRLRDGARLPVSRSAYAAFQSALVRYLNR